MHQKFLRRRCCQWFLCSVVTVLVAGCAPIPEAINDELPSIATVGSFEAAPWPAPPARQPATALTPDAYTRITARDKGLGIKANKPTAREDADTPEDVNRYELNPPRESDQQGLASWYGEQFHGRRTASGERFDSGGLTAAHRDLPFGSRVCVRSSVTGKSVIVRINDRGPFAPGRVIDLSKAAAQELGMLGLGIKPVELWQLDEDEDECPIRLAAAGKKRAPSTAGAAASKVRAASATQPVRKAAVKRVASSRK